ncbi:hypothetical protein [Teredinibacter sp. KSP-S5-2]|uniref:hypothetical protein n=1 Tax=Teredinibacter sp. KSP-S5-2 TaxID=3034506 RepID=UPI002934AE3C|nr:hypothetical protein [Teredinibacter sp. KSP-S5-2]WNO10567.1 hypothetical protein P5V12_05210 [Teredinibacter sp. KSP-S5-2]
MTIEYTILEDLELVVSRVYGTFTNDELYNHFSVLASDRRFCPRYSLRYVSQMQVTPDGIKQAAKRKPFDSLSATVLLIPSSYEKGMAHFWGVLSTSSNAYFYVTDNVDDALERLGISAKKPNIEPHLYSPSKQSAPL